MPLIDRSSLAEEKRLLYVALTRAKENLFLSWARERSFGDNNPIKREPSDWLEPIDEAIQALDQPLNQTGQIDQIAKARKKMASTVSFRSPVMTSLRSWRNDRAKFSDRQAYEILTNATLDSLIQIWPSTLEELLGVHGIGPFKAERYGEELLSILDQFSELKPKTPTLKAIENKAVPKNGDQRLPEDLRSWRAEMAAGKPAFTIFNDKTLADLTKKRPKNIDELLAVHGIGPAKVKKFGQDLLEFFKE